MEPAGPKIAKENQIINYLRGRKPLNYTLKL